MRQNTVGVFLACHLTGTPQYKSNAFPLFFIQLIYRTSHLKYFSVSWLFGKRKEFWLMLSNYPPPHPATIQGLRHLVHSPLLFISCHHGRLPGYIDGLSNTPVEFLLQDFSVSPFLTSYSSDCWDQAPWLFTKLYQDLGLYLN